MRKRSLGELSHKGAWRVLLSALLVAVTFFVFGPIEIYISNMTELWFPIQDVLFPSILAGIAAFALLALVGFLLRGRWREWYCCLLTGVGIALYIQGNFLQTDYGVLDGREIPWEAYRTVAVWNTILWIVCIALPFVIRWKWKKQYQSGAALVAGCVLLVQVITLGTLAITTDFSKYEHGDYYLSSKDLYSVSSEKNVIIFVLDTFAQEFLESIVVDHPDVMDPLDGFTYYTNATCAYPTTAGSMPFILTGQYYKNDQLYKEHINEAYQNTDFYEQLNKAGYDISLYTGGAFVSESTKGTLIKNAANGSPVVSSYVGLEKAMLQFAAFRYFPHIAKQWVWLYTGMFDEIKETPDASPIHSEDNLKFYSGLKEEGLQVTSDRKSYSLIHLLGTHGPFLMNEDATAAEEGTATYWKTEGIACMRIIGEYVRQLKELGVYDDTMLVITADHGVGFRSFPIFLVKDFNSKGEVRESDAPVSHANLFASVMDALGLNTDQKYGISIYDIPELETIERRYFWYQWDAAWDKDYLPDMTEFIVTEEGDMIEVGNRYTSQSEETFIPYAYKMGTVLQFHTVEEIWDCFQNGVANIETGIEGMWSLGETGRLAFDVGDYTGNAVCEFQFDGLFGSPQRLIVRCGGQTLYNADIVSAAESVDFLIPEECIRDGVITLELEFPNATSPKTLGIGESISKRAFHFTSICLREA